MSYCTVEDIKNAISERRLIELSNDQDSSVVNEAVVNAAIQRADGMIDAFCGKRYIVPFSSPPEAIKSLSIELTIYFLYSRKSEAPEDIQKRYEEAVKTLEKIAKGELELGSPLKSKADMFEGYEGSIFTMEVLEDASAD